MIDGIAQHDDLVLHQTAMNFYLALVGNSGLTDESFTKQQENARDAYYDILGAVRPWTGLNSKERKKREIQDMRSAYEEAFGVSLDDPEFIAQEKEAVAKWVADRAQQREDFESDEDRIQRLRKKAKEKARAAQEAQRKRRQGR